MPLAKGLSPPLAARGWLGSLIDLFPLRPPQVDDESKPERRPTKHMRTPNEWDLVHNPAYAYYAYYVWVRLGAAPPTPTRGLLCSWVAVGWPCCVRTYRVKRRWLRIGAAR